MSVNDFIFSKLICTKIILLVHSYFMKRATHIFLLLILIRIVLVHHGQVVQHEIKRCDHWRVRALYPRAEIAPIIARIEQLLHDYIVLLAVRFIDVLCGYKR